MRGRRQVETGKKRQRDVRTLKIKKCHSGGRRERGRRDATQEEITETGGETETRAEIRGERCSHENIQNISVLSQSLRWP